MWAPRYYAQRYFAGRYYANATAGGGGGGGGDPPPTGPFVQAIPPGRPRPLFPAAPLTWSASSRSAWANLINALETSPAFTYSYRTRPSFLVASTVSAPLTLDVNNPNVSVLSQVLAKLLVALAPSPYIAVR